MLQLEAIQFTLYEKPVRAVLYHSTHFKNEGHRHGMYPRNKKTWCIYQSDQLKRKKKLTQLTIQLIISNYQSNIY